MGDDEDEEEKTEDIEVTTKDAGRTDSRDRRTEKEKAGW